MNFAQFSMFAHRAVAGCMAIWLSGFVLLFCCNEMEAAVAESGSHDPAAAISSHCRTQGDTSAPAFQNRSTAHESFDCCGFIPVLLDKVRKVESTEQIVVVTPSVVVERPVPAPRRSVSPFRISYRAVTLLRGDTYLKNRTFRI